MGLFSKISVPPEQPAVGNLNSLTPPDFPLKYKLIHEQKTDNTELNYKKIQNRQRARVKRYSLTWNNINKTDRDAIQAFYDARVGKLIPFLWTPPGASVAEKYYFFEDLNGIKVNPDVYILKVTIEQLEPSDLNPPPGPAIVGPLNETVQWERTSVAFNETADYNRQFADLVGPLNETIQYPKDEPGFKFSETIEYSKEEPDILFSETIEYPTDEPGFEFGETIEYLKA